MEKSARDIAIDRIKIHLDNLERRAVLLEDDDPRSRRAQLDIDAWAKTLDDLESEKNEENLESERKRPPRFASNGVSDPSEG